MDIFFSDTIFRNVGKAQVISVATGALFTAGGAVSYWLTDSKTISAVVACCGVGICASSYKNIKELASKRLEIDEKLRSERNWLTSLLRCVEPLTWTVLFDRPIVGPRSVTWDSTIQFLGDVENNMENQLSAVCFWNEVDNYSAFSFSCSKQYLDEMDYQLIKKLNNVINNDQELVGEDINIQDTDLLERILSEIEGHSEVCIEGVKVLMVNPNDELEKSKEAYSINNSVRYDERKHSNIGLVDRPSGSTIYPDSPGHNRDTYHPEKPTRHGSKKSKKHSKKSKSSKKDKESSKKHSNKSEDCLKEADPQSPVEATSESRGLTEARAVPHEPMGADSDPREPMAADSDPRGRMAADSDPRGRMAADSDPRGRMAADSDPRGRMAADSDPRGRMAADSDPRGRMAAESNREPMAAESGRPEPRTAERGRRVSMGAGPGRRVRMGTELRRREPIGAELVRPEPIGAELVRPEPIGAELVRREPIGAALVRREPIGAERGRQVRMGAGPGRRGRMGAELRRREQMGAEPGRRVPMRAEPGRRVPMGAEPGQRVPMGAEPGRREQMGAELYRRVQLEAEPGRREPMAAEPGPQQPMGAEPDPQEPMGAQAILEAARRTGAIPKFRRNPDHHH